MRGFGIGATADGAVLGSALAESATNAIGGVTVDAELGVTGCGAIDVGGEGDGGRVGVEPLRTATPIAPTAATATTAAHGHFARGGA